MCDITPELKSQAKIANLEETPDKEGYFGYNKNYNAMFEIISFTKMVSDAKKRNAAFFHKLGLSSHTGTV